MHAIYVDDYRQHTSCITEAERYEKSVYKGPKSIPNSNGKKNGAKLNPQDQWTNLIVYAAEHYNGDSPTLLKLFQQLSSYTNVPRKEKQFRNFTINSLNLKDYGKSTANSELVGEMWNYLSKLREDERKAKEDADKKIKEEQEAKKKKKEEEEKEQQKDKEKATKSKKDKSKSSSSSSSSSKTTTGKSTIPEKKVVKAMKKILKKSPKQQLKMKKLQKKMEKKLKEETAQIDSDELKQLIQSQIDIASNNMKLDGKIVTLVVS